MTHHRCTPLVLSIAVGLLGACVSQEASDADGDGVDSAESALGTSVTIKLQNGVAPSAGYAGTTDTTLAQAAPTTNDGTGVTLAADMDTPSGTGKADDALLRFDVSAIPAGSTIQSVKLTTNVSSPTSGVAYQVYALKRTWNEAQATWNNAATGSTWNAAGARGASDRGTTVLGTYFPTTTGSYTLSLDPAGIAVVQGWVGAPASNFGFVIDGTTDQDGARFDSSEVSIAADRPALVITYAPAIDPNHPYGAYGSYKPGATTTGVRAGTTLISYTNQFGPIVNGTLTLTTPNIKISGYNIPAYIAVKAANITIDNCLVRGPATLPATGGQQLIAGYDTKSTNLTVQDCTLVPDVPDHDVGGLQAKSFLAQRNNVYNVVDGIDPLNDGSVILANYIHDLSWFTPDNRHADNHTHNDCIQFEGGSATVRYNNLQGFLSKTVGQGPTRPYDQSNSVMLASPKSPISSSNLVITNNWIDGGGVAVNFLGSYTDLGTLSNNVFGDNQYYKRVTIDLDQPRASIGLTLTNNIYEPIDRPLANPALKGTTVATGNGIQGG